MEAIIHSPFDRIPLKDRQQEAMRTLMRGLELLKKSLVKHSIGCGTFLGLYRDGKFIDHDLDIDINVIMDWNTDNKDDINYILHLFKEWRLIRTVYHEGKPLQIAYMSNENVIFDLTFYYTGIKENKVISYSTCGTVEEDSRFFEGLLPTPAEEYLEQRYGDWKTPTESFDEWNTYCKSLVSKEIVGIS